MIQPRRRLVDPTQAQFFHLINRCVRLFWLCGQDRYSGEDFEHHKDQIRKNETISTQYLAPLACVQSVNVPPMTEAEYIDLVNIIGRELHPGKRGVIKANEPKAIRKLAG